MATINSNNLGVYAYDAAMTTPLEVLDTATAIGSLTNADAPTGAADAAEAVASRCFGAGRGVRAWHHPTCLGHALRVAHRIAGGCANWAICCYLS